MTAGKPRLPGHLRRETRAWYARVISEYELQEHHARILEAACSAWDRMVQAREEIDRDGLTALDRYGNRRQHPAVPVERDSRLAFLRALRELDLDGEPMPDPRPLRRR